MSFNGYSDHKINKKTKTESYLSILMSHKGKIQRLKKHSLASTQGQDVNGCNSGLKHPRKKCTEANPPDLSPDSDNTFSGSMFYDESKQQCHCPVSDKDKSYASMLGDTGSNTDKCCVNETTSSDSIAATPQIPSILSLISGHSESSVRKFDSN